MVPKVEASSYPRSMSSSAEPRRDVVDLNEGADPQQRAEARAWAKRVLAEARAARTPEALAAMRAKIGMPPLPSHG
jgi:hypothetical protein